jgi:hypothetical protein
MAWLFLICAVIGGTVIVCQFLLTLFGFGMEHGLDGGGHDMPHDFGHVDASHAMGGHDGHADQAHPHDSSWLFGVISFRTLTAAVAFFGLGGFAANASSMPTAAQVIIGLFCGACALFGVHWLFKQLSRLSADGTEQISRAIGEVGSVYLTVPSRGGGQGKVQFELQGRLVEYPAVTNSLEPLATGSKVRVVGISGSVVQVESSARPSKVEVG